MGVFVSLSPSRFGFYLSPSDISRFLCVPLSLPSVPGSLSLTFSLFVVLITRPNPSCASSSVHSDSRRVTYPSLIKLSFRLYREWGETMCSIGCKIVIARLFNPLLTILDGVFLIHRRNATIRQCLDNAWAHLKTVNHTREECTIKSETNLLILIASCRIMNETYRPLTQSKERAYRYQHDSSLTPSFIQSGKDRMWAEIKGEWEVIL